MDICRKNTSSLLKTLLSWRTDIDQHSRYCTKQILKASIQRGAVIQKQSLSSWALLLTLQNSPEKCSEVLKRSITFPLVGTLNSFLPFFNHSLALALMPFTNLCLICPGTHAILGWGNNKTTGMHRYSKAKEADQVSMALFRASRVPENNNRVI